MAEGPSRRLRVSFVGLLLLVTGAVVAWFSSPALRAAVYGQVLRYGPEAVATHCMDELVQLEALGGFELFRAACDLDGARQSRAKEAFLGLEEEALPALSVAFSNEQDRGLALDLAWDMVKARMADPKRIHFRSFRTEHLVIQRMVEVLPSFDDQRVMPVLLLIGCFGDRAEPAIVELKRRARSDERLVRSMAVSGLLLIGAAAAEPLREVYERQPELRPDVLKGLPHCEELARVLIPKIWEVDPDGKESLIGVLATLSSKAAPVFRDLYERSEDPEWRWRIVVALRKYSNDRPEVCLKLAETALKDRDVRVQGEAILSLGELGAGAASAREALKGFLKHPEPQLQQAAEQALARIEEALRAR